MQVTSRIEFKNYCLRKLGAPVIQINISDEQVDDRLDEAIQKYWEYHGDGTLRVYLNYTLEDIDLQRQYLVLPDYIVSVIRLLPIGSTTTDLNLQYVQFVNSLVNNQVISISSDTTLTMTSFVVTQQYVNLFNHFFLREKELRFNHVYGRLYIDGGWNDYHINDILVIETLAYTNPEEHRRAYNDIWLKKYATALIKEQWGQNLIKYANFQLPGGITVDGRSIYADAQTEKEILEQELISTYSLPPDMMIG